MEMNEFDEFLNEDPVNESPDSSGNGSGSVPSGDKKEKKVRIIENRQSVIGTPGYLAPELLSSQVRSHCMHTE